MEIDPILKDQALQEFKDSLYKLRSKRTVRRSINSSRFSNHIRGLQRDSNITK